MVFSHIVFADDVLLFIEAKENNLLKVKKLLQDFGEHIDLMMNERESQIYISNSTIDKGDQLANAKGIRLDNFPTKYLRFPLSGGNLTCVHFEGCLDSLKRKLDIWPTKKMPMVGRVVITNLVVNGLINFWLQQGDVPASILSRMEMIASNFLWTGEGHVMACK